MKQDKYREELFESLAIGIKKDFERANRKRAKSNESPLSFSEFADTFMEYRKAYKKGFTYLVCSCFNSCFSCLWRA